MRCVEAICLASVGWRHWALWDPLRICLAEICFAGKTGVPCCFLEVRSPSRYSSAGVNFCASLAPCSYSGWDLHCEVGLQVNNFLGIFSLFSCSYLSRSLRRGKFMLLVGLSCMISSYLVSSTRSSEWRFAAWISVTITRLRPHMQAQRRMSLQLCGRHCSASIFSIEDVMSSFECWSLFLSLTSLQKPRHVA